MQQPAFNVICTSLTFKYDPILYTSNAQYVKDFNNKTIYFILKIVQRNPNITTNQVCSLLRNTLHIPEDITRGCLTVLINTSVLKAFKETNSIVHLRCNNDRLCSEIINIYPELDMYSAPVYKRGNSKGGNVARQVEVN